MTIGVYRITNKVNKKVYIGASIDVDRRLAEHTRTANNPTHERSHLDLYKDMRKYGIENFNIEIIEQCSRAELLLIESKYIYQHDSIRDGYNSMVNSSGKEGLKASIRERELKYGVDKNKLLTLLETNSMRDVGKVFNVSDNTIRKWLKHYGLSTKSKDYETEYKRHKFSETMRITAKVSSTKKKRIAMVDKTTNSILKEFDSIADASEYVGTTYQNITRAIKGTEGRKTSMGYKWEFL